jgi:hypothetical protein
VPPLEVPYYHVLRSYVVAADVAAVNVAPADVVVEDDDVQPKEHHEAFARVLPSTHSRADYDSTNHVGGISVRRVQQVEQIGRTLRRATLIVTSDSWFTSSEESCKSVEISEGLGRSRCD